jgi:hypothetical protein
MTASTPRRTENLKLRQTISQLLDEIFAIEHSMDLFHRKGDRGELDRAAHDFHAMLEHVERLGNLIADARGKQHASAEVHPNEGA